MKITEKNIRKVSDRVYGFRQQWRCRVQVKNVVHYAASPVFFLLSIFYIYPVLSVILFNDTPGETLPLLAFLEKLWRFLVDLFTVSGKPDLSALIVFFALYAAGFLAAAVAALVVVIRYKKEPRPKPATLSYSKVSSMATGMKIYQERVSPLESFHGKCNSILSLVFALLSTGLVAYFFAGNHLFSDNWEAFAAWAIFGTVGAWIVHRLLLGLLTLPVALLYYFPTPAPGLRRALEKKAEALRPVHKYTGSQNKGSYGGGSTGGYAPSHTGKLEQSIYYDWRTGERLMRNESGQIVNGKGETVSSAWWD